MTIKIINWVPPKQRRRAIIKATAISLYALTLLIVGTWFEEYLRHVIYGGVTIFIWLLAYCGMFNQGNHRE